MSNEKILAEYFWKNYPIEQMKGSMYRKDDIYFQMPMLIFRFSTKLDEKIYDELKECIESFEGHLKWTEFKNFIGRRIWNHFIAPISYYEKSKYAFENDVIMSDREYFSDEEYRKLCEKGIEDIPLLFEHIKKNFNPNLKTYTTKGEKILKILDWSSPEDELTYGNTFISHGEHLKIPKLMTKAKNSGQQLGQWQDNQRAADFIAEVAQKKGVGIHDVVLPSSTTESFPAIVYLATGFKHQADKARIIVKEDGSIETAYPFSSKHPH